ncbi:hypothetical protein FB385_1442 [Paramicrobacterium agarici]|nr:hypothetical protein FB385_1442 [Microbacterium agarici]
MGNYCNRKSCLGKPAHKTSSCPRNPSQRPRTTAKDGDVKNPPRPSPSYERCGKCGALVVVVIRDATPIGFEKHKIPSSPTWCANGTQPVARKKVKGAHRGKSVRTIGGGLPSLGKRT